MEVVNIHHEIRIPILQTFESVFGFEIFEKQNHICEQETLSYKIKSIISNIALVCRLSTVFLSRFLKQLR